ncbi:MAG TPA: hypothetical protein VD731_05905 [Nitrosopumilaceae archaeon]|nr:hypothetical protein [Nitrosopumilaceae archaeon]
MDAMLEEEMIDLITFCIQNPNSSEVSSKKNRISEIGKTLYLDGGVDAMENMFFAIQNRIIEEIGTNPISFRSLWNENSKEWKY